jgi:ubiquinone/menaquinone biosynthesis C-methylase UbiE
MRPTLTTAPIGTYDRPVADQDAWQLPGGAPELYERHLVPAVTAAWASDLVDRAALRSGERVLDVACGTGVVARLAATRVGATGRVAGLDLNAGMLAVARSLPPPRGASIDWCEGDVAALPFPDAAFDVAFCQLGLQFFPDRPAALAEIRRTLADGGRLALNVYGPLEHNPAPRALAEALDRHVGTGASRAKRAEHALADTHHLGRLLAAAGFREVVISTVTRIVHFPSVTAYVAVQLAATPLAALDAGDTAPRERVVEALTSDVGTALAPYVEPDGLSFPQEAHVALAAC